MKTPTWRHLGLMGTSVLFAVTAMAQRTPVLHLSRVPDALVPICQEHNPFLLPANGEAALFSPSDGRIWLARPQPLEEPQVEATPAMVRPFAVAYDPASRVLAIAALQSSGKGIGLFIFEDGALKETETLSAPPMSVIFWQGDVLVAFSPGRIWASLDEFPHLQRFDLRKKEWSTVLSVGAPSWAAKEETLSDNPSTGNATAQHPKATAEQPSSTGQRWGCGLPVARRDGRLWWVNVFDGTVRLLSKSGAEEWKGQLVGVSRRRLTSSEREERIKKIRSDVPGTSSKTIAVPPLMPVVTRVAGFENDLLALVTASPGSPQGGVVVLRDLDRESGRLAFENGETPNGIAVGNDGTVWFANPWGTVPGATLGLAAPPLATP
jgi:hypothetical protein